MAEIKRRGHLFRQQKWWPQIPRLTDEELQACYDRVNALRNRPMRRAPERESPIDEFRRTLERVEQRLKWRKTSP